MRWLYSYEQKRFSSFQHGIVGVSFPIDAPALQKRTLKIHMKKLEKSFSIIARSKNEVQ